MCITSNLTNRHPATSCPIRLEAVENPLVKFIRGMSRSLCLDNLMPRLAQNISYCFNANNLGPAWAEKASRQYLNHPSRNQVKHFARTGTENARLIVHTKSNLIEAILKIKKVLRQHLKLVSLAHHPNEFIDTVRKTMGKLGFRVTGQVCQDISQIRQSCCTFEKHAV